jgi:hypothetical protein
MPLRRWPNACEFILGLNPYNDQRLRLFMSAWFGNFSERWGSEPLFLNFLSHQIHRERYPSAYDNPDGQAESQAQRQQLTGKLLFRSSSHQILSPHMQTSIPQCRPENIAPYPFRGDISQLCRSIPLCGIGMLESKCVYEVLCSFLILREIDIRDTQVESTYQPNSVIRGI